MFQDLGFSFKNPIKSNKSLKDFVKSLSRDIQKMIFATGAARHEEVTNLG